MKAQGYTKETIKNIGITNTLPTSFNVGDTIAIHQNIKEGDKSRVQVFEGDVIAIHKKGASSTFTVRKIGANGIAVERIIPFSSPLIKEIQLVRSADVRRSKLYYVRDLVGKAARFKEKVVTRTQKEQKAQDLDKNEKAAE